MTSCFVFITAANHTVKYLGILGINDRNVPITTVLLFYDSVYAFKPIKTLSLVAGRVIRKSTAFD